MSSESERRLSTEELKRLNQSSKAAPPPMVLLPAADWNMLLTRLDSLEASVGTQEALLRALSQQAGQCPTQAQMEALARDVAEIRAILLQAGKRNEKRFSLPSIRLPRPSLPYIPWTSLLLGLVALALTGLVLWVVWSSLDTLWSAARGLLP